MAKMPIQAAIETIPAEVVTEMVTDLIELRKMGKPKSDEEVKTRCDQYFRYCANSSLRPGIETLSLALGIDRRTLWAWSCGRGCSPERAEIARAARQTVIAYVEAAQLNGKLNPVTSIFLLKNWANYRDAVQIEDVRQDALQATLSPEEIAERIRKDIPIDTPEQETTEDEEETGANDIHRRL